MSQERYPARNPDQLTNTDEKASYNTTLSILQGLVGKQKEHVYKGPNNELYGHFGTFTYTPKYTMQIMKAVEELYKLDVASNLREVVINTTAASFGAPYPSYVHKHMAIDFTTLSKQQFDSIIESKKPIDLKEDESIIYDVTKHLCTSSGPLPSQSFEKASALVGKGQLLSIIHFIGMYSLISIVNNGANSGYPDDI